MKLSESEVRDEIPTHPETPRKINKYRTSGGPKMGCGTFRTILQSNDFSGAERLPCGAIYNPHVGQRTTVCDELNEEALIDWNNIKENVETNHADPNQLR